MVALGSFLPGQRHSLARRHKYGEFNTNRNRARDSPSTIEPIHALDAWTAVTRDRSLSAQFEHSVGVTGNGVEIFTLSQRHAEKPPAT
jgi:methionine aminopeptidase